jgi:hypothetical protein
MAEDATRGLWNKSHYMSNSVLYPLTLPARRSPSLPQRISSRASISSTSNKTTPKCILGIGWQVRRPVRSAGGKGAELPESEFVSESGTNAFPQKMEMLDMRKYAPFWQRLSGEEQEELRKEWNHPPGWTPSPGLLVKRLAAHCDNTYPEQIPAGDWHEPMETELVTNALCRLFVSKHSRKAMTAVFNDEDVYQFLESTKTDSICHVALAKRDPHHNDRGEKYDLAREC